jgi:hypothetical protein
VSNELALIERVREIERFLARDTVDLECRAARDRPSAQAARGEPLLDAMGACAVIDGE